MLTFPDPNVETEYTDPNGAVWEFNGTGWVRQCESSGGGGGGGGDGDIGGVPFVEFVLNGENAADGSQDIVDASGRHNIAIYNDVYIDTTVKKFGSGSLDFTRGGGYLSIGSSPHLTIEQDITVPYTKSFVEGEIFTIEGWFRNAGTSKGNIISHWRPVSSAHPLNEGWHIFTQNDNLNWQRSSDGSTVLKQMTNNGLVKVGQWHHFAATWDGANYRLFVDGQLGDHPTNPTPSDIPTMSCNTSSIIVGAQLKGKEPGDYLQLVDAYNGHIDDLTITMGVCKYTADFTPPGEIQTTSLLKASGGKTVVRRVELEITESDEDDPSEPENNITTEES